MVETLVAIAILMIAAVAPLTIAEKSLAAARAAKDEIEAFYLAQEAFEFVRNRRDTNVISKENWLQGLALCMRLEYPNGCGIDPSDDSGNQIVPCGANNDFCTLYVNDGSTSPKLKSIYGHPPAGWERTGWEKTKIQRAVRIKELVRDTEAMVEVTIMRTGTSIGRTSFVLGGNIFRWYQP